MKYIALFFVLLFLNSNALEAQMEIKFTRNGFQALDVNDSGVAVGDKFAFHFITDENIFYDIDELIQIRSISNNGSMCADLAHPNSDENTTIKVPGYLLAEENTWTQIGYFSGYSPQAGDFSTAHAISGNGRFIAGQLSVNAAQGRMFLFNTETGELLDFHNASIAKHSAGYEVDNEGIVYGWMDPNSAAGTLRVPVIAEDGNYTTVVPANSLVTIINAVEGSTSDGSQLVGAANGQPFIYEVDQNEIQFFEIPSGFTSSTFTDISNNGICVGYAWDLSDPSILIREAIIYHPSFGEQPLFLKDFLSSKGLEIPLDQTDAFIDGRMGTAHAISDNGEYIVGGGDFVNFAFSNARSWVVHLGSLLTSNEDLTTTTETIKVFPNPGSARIQFDAESDILTAIDEVRIIDLTGRIVRTQAMEPTISVCDLSSGNYILQFLSADDRLIGVRKWTKR